MVRSPDLDFPQQFHKDKSIMNIQRRVETEEHEIQNECIQCF